MAARPSPYPVLDGPALLRLLRRRLGVVLLLTVLGAAAGYGVSRLQPKQYKAEQQLVITGQVANPLVVDLAQGTSDPERIIQTQIGLLTSPAIERQARASLGQAPGKISATASSNSNLLDVKVVGDSRRRALADLAAYVSAYLGLVRRQGDRQAAVARRTLLQKIDGYNAQLRASRSLRRSEVLRDERRSLQTTVDQLDAARSLGNNFVEPVGEASAASRPSSPRPAVDVVLGALLGALLAALLVVSRRPLTTGA